MGIRWEMAHSFQSLCQFSWFVLVNIQRKTNANIPVPNFATTEHWRTYLTGEALAVLYKIRLNRIFIRDAPDQLSGRIVDFSTIRYPAG